MNTGIDIEFVRENYRQMTDDELVRIATQEAAGLTIEAQQVVKEEIERRKLDISIFEAVKAQNKELTLEEIDNYCSIIRNCACPSCGTTASKLNATLTSEVMSFIFFTHWRKKIKIACPNCLDKANNNALLISALAGWWGIPWGLIRTPIAIGQNVKSKKTNHLDTPNDYLRGFALAKIGQLETYKNNTQALQQIISAK